jgi:DNA invertase Pin-like site-specific DNA recombinase
MSGARDDRPGLADLMAYVRAGDTIVAWKLDQLGRNTLHVLEMCQGAYQPGSLACIGNG